MRCPRSVAAPPSTSASSSLPESAAAVNRAALWPRGAPVPAQGSCGGVLSGARDWCRRVAPTQRAAWARTPRIYARARLVDIHGRPIRAAQLAPETNYVFHYPYEATPCLLLKLRAPVADAADAEARGRQPLRVARRRGPRAHDRRVLGDLRAQARLSDARGLVHPLPARPLGDVGRRASSIAAPTTASTIRRRARASCRGPRRSRSRRSCSSTIAATDELFALGTVGAEQFDAFFDKYEVKLALEYGGQGAPRRSATAASCASSPHYCRTTIQC